MPELLFQRGAVLCYRIFDIASEVNLERAQALLAQDGRRLKLGRAGSEYLQLLNPPLTIELPRKSLPVRSGAVTVDVSARVFGYGAASVILRVPIEPGTSLERLIPLADELYDSAAVDSIAADSIAQLRQMLAPALEDSHLWGQSESYTVVFAERIEGNPSPAKLLAEADLARLLLGEAGERPLSERERADVLEHHFSYTEDDLVVVDWNAAFVYEPTGSGDIPDLLEIANAQLLEFRYYDDVLDSQLADIYRQMASQRRGWRSILWSPYKVLARKVLVTLMELNEFIERVENSLKIIGDFYLAKVYEAAVKQLRIGAWQASVTRKQRTLAQTYELLKGEVDTDRALTLEATIVLLIVGEILFAVLSVWRQ
ncbi:MAG: hypothetical protein HYZ28_12060 [Myxococcales bacterium]|nr:hypothetical protein [Myxococcales bacterium]